MSSCLYIDGLGLYYGSVRGTPYRWLNLEAFADTFGFEPPIRRIHYFTAHDPDPERRARQDTYLRALRTFPRMRVHECAGTHAIAELSQRLHEDDKAGRFNLAVVLTIDGRLAPAIETMNMATCALLPYRRKLDDPSVRAAATFIKRISRSSLETNQLADVLTDGDGSMRRPDEWHQ